ncbi:MAG: N-acetylmuramoyl-L-alanine amidase, partial [Flavisolibacter sp.]|nr:N-acetylmuramoyl-L-alanine amidase [Flavisolibacter sp.]
HHKVHSKIYIIDDELAIIGSANLSSRSMTHDSETAAVIFNDPGSVTNFVSQLKFKENYDPDTNIIPYEPNKNIKDLDVEIIDDLNNLSTAKKIALSLGGPVIGSMIPQVIKTLVTQFKPAIIDIIDPDADNTQPQQEIPEEVKEVNLYYGNDNIKGTALRTPFLHAEADTDKEYAYKESTETNDLEATAWNNEFEAWNEDGNYLNEQPDYPTSEQFNYDKEYTSAFTNPSDNEVAEIMEHQAALAKSSAPNTKTCEGRTCWAKEVLNRLSGISLTIDNRLDEVTKKAIADFQAKNNLPVTQRIDAATERALLEADAINRNNGTAMQKAAIELITTAKTKIEDWTKKAVNNKPQYILDSYRDPRKVYAFVLHHMAFKRRSRKTGKYSDPESYLSTGAHFCILFDGRIIQLHPFSRMIWHGHCISPRSVAVEFEGNFPNIKGKWWIDKEAKFPDKDVPTQQQYESGRFLTSYLKIVLGTTHILAHRQSSKDRENDPGPDIWYNVGQWAGEKLGLSDGGPTFKCGDGNPILPEWRTWGNKTSTIITKEYGEEQEMEPEDIASESHSFEPALEEAEDFYSDELEAQDLYNGTDDFTTDWSKAVQLNRRYGEQLGWNRYYDKINDFLLPYSGQKNVSLGEEAFAQAVAVWQQKQGFPAKDCDGIIGPNTWRVMKPQIVADTSSPTVPVSGSPSSIELPPPVFSSDKVPAGFRKGSYKDWQGLDRKSNVRVDEAARIISKKFDLKSLGITEIDIDTFQRIASAETGGKIQNFYSYDRAIVSMGFRQFTFIHNNIHDWIKKAPSAFKRYGIEIDQSLPPYSIRQGSNTYTVARIKGVDDPEALRWNGWAQRFYYAGLDYEIIVAEFLLTKEYFSKEIGRLKMYLKNVPDQFALFTNFYNQSGHLRAFFHELNNAAPARVPPITAEALKKVSQGESADQFLNIYFETAKQKWPDAEQVVRIFNNTKSGSKIKIFENEATNEEVTYEAEWKDELESESSYSNADEMELESPAIENYSLAYNLSKLDDWAYLLKFKVPDT